MSPRAAVLVFLAVAVVLWPHLAALAAVTVIAGVLMVLGTQILNITRCTGWGVVPVRRSFR